MALFERRGAISVVASLFAAFGMFAALRLSAQQPAPAQQPPAPPPVQRTPGAPEGDVIKAEFERSQVYPAPGASIGSMFPSSSIARSRRRSWSFRTASSTARRWCSTT